jgi:choline kinase
MKEPILVIMAAGMGSRFGGLKQIAPMDKYGNKIIDFSVYDAVRAGFKKVVFIIKKAIEADFKASVGETLAKHVEVEYVYQELDKLPEGYTVPEGREKPWGTAHAILCCKDVVDAPFAVINADDYYGVGAFKTIYDYLVTIKDEEPYDYAMVGYVMENTLSENGGVTRGVCEQKDGYLSAIAETSGIQRRADGKVVYEGENGEVVADSKGLVSMNFWGYRANYLPRIRTYFHDFLRGLSPDEQKAECLLPVMAGDLLQAGELSLRVDTTLSHWFGMTYREDRQEVSDKLAALHTAGAYPQTLF